MFDYHNLIQFTPKRTRSQIYLGDFGNFFSPSQKRGKYILNFYHPGTKFSPNTPFLNPLLQRESVVRFNPRYPRRLILTETPVLIRVVLLIRHSRGSLLPETI
jgi:hypothetical protein